MDCFSLMNIYQLELDKQTNKRTTIWLSSFIKCETHN